jgi:hypothetical protein
MELARKERFVSYVSITLIKWRLLAVVSSVIFASRSSSKRIRAVLLSCRISPVQAACCLLSSLTNPLAFTSWRHSY